MRYAWIDQQVGQYPLSSLCGVLSVSVNGYRAWKRGGKSGRTRLTDTQLLTLIWTVHAEVKGAYGSPPMTPPHGLKHVSRCSLNRSSAVRTPTLAPSRSPETSTPNRRCAKT